MANSSTHRRINATKDYRLFTFSDDNRARDIRKHKVLMGSMRKHGFLACFPIICFRTASGKLKVKDGQHRLAIAEMLGLTIYWVETDEDFDVAETNSASVAWKMRDYAERWVVQGKDDYRELVAFADAHNFPLSLAAAVLCGTTSFGNIRDKFYCGDYVITDRDHATRVAMIYKSLAGLNHQIKNARFIEACIAVSRVDGFDIGRLAANAKRRRDMIVPYSTRDAYLKMIEEIYNFGRRELVGVCALAVMAMRERNPATPAKPK